LGGKQGRENGQSGSFHHDTGDIKSQRVIR